jgi:NADH-quinone oxidoreductase subunit H
MMGGLRSSAQMISYELSLGLAFVSPVLIAGSLSLGDIVDAQNPIWFIVYQPLGALIFFIAGLAELNRGPFDMPEAEQELVAGYHVEYSGMKFAMFYMAEYGKMIVVAFIFATLFLGGYRGPFIDQVPALGPLYVLVKVFLILFVMIWIRGTWPRIRYDRLMAFGWKVMLPLALANVFVTAVIVVLIGG